MRPTTILLGGLVVGTAGCLAPFSWPDDRRDDAEPIALLTRRTAELSAADALTRAADCLDRGDEAAAIPHLRGYIRAYPDAVLVRAHLAELLYRHGEAAEARTQFERFAGDAASTSGPVKERLVQCHTRLMELADAAGDPYRASLHRGIGLLLLVERWDADPSRRDDIVAEQTLSKALTAFREAKSKRPSDTRANLYLAVTYDRLGQGTSARTAWRAARAGLPDPSLTDAERDQIADAMRR